MDTREDRDPEIALAPAGDLEPPRFPPDLSPAVRERITREFAQILALVGQHRYASAYKVLETWPESVWGKLGKDTELLSGVLHYKTEFYGDAIDQLKPLADDPSYVARRPALLYYLGRAYYANANYRKAVAALERYIPAQRAAGQPLLPISARPVP